ncbi:MAG: hypothetical protein ACW99Q_27015 [Candidatus Kariarchaeaceae archaeon]|jgi:hypothetical protein
METLTFLDYEIATIPLIVILLEGLLILTLIIGWYLGARRLNINLHHYMVYSGTLIHFIIFLVWMFPGFLNSLPRVLSNPLPKLLHIFHWSFGLVAVILSVFLTILFFFNRDIPLDLLRKVRPLMIVTFICWIIALVLGAIIFLSFRVQEASNYDYYTIFLNIKSFI